MSSTTKDNLLLAADEVFAERGFRDATIQEIVRRAGANIAAVHYHFGDKASFYAEWIARTLDRGAGTQPSLADHAGDAAAALAAFVRWHLRRLMGSGSSAMLGAIQAHEMASPTPLLDKVVDKVVRPQLVALREIVLALLPEGVEEAVVRRHLFSIVGQCTFYRHARPVLERLDPGRTLDDAELETLAAHITRVSLAGLAQEGRS